MLIHNNFRSWCLQTNTDINIIVPDVKEGESWANHFQKKYPVLWLLHGTWGGYTDFVRRTNIDLYAKERNLIVVVPNGLNMEYSNWNQFNLGYRMFDHLFDELMPMIYNTLPASSDKADNYIAGLSMGSMGAFKYAINRPDRFAGCGCMSGTPSDIKTNYENHELNQRILFDIQMAGGIENYLDSYENTWALTQQKANDPDLPDFYFCIGKEDFLYPDYLAYETYANQVGFKATFEAVDGYAHEWRFWDLELQKLLDHWGLKGVRNITTAKDFKPIDPSTL